MASGACEQIVETVFDQHLKDIFQKNNDLNHIGIRLIISSDSKLSGLGLTKDQIAKITEILSEISKELTGSGDHVFKSTKEKFQNRLEQASYADQSLLEIPGTAP